MTTSNLRECEKAQLLRIVQRFGEVYQRMDARSAQAAGDRAKHQKLPPGPKNSPEYKKYRKEIEAAIIADPDGKPTDLVVAAKCSRDTIKKYRERLREEGRI